MIIEFIGDVLELLVATTIAILHHVGYPLYQLIGSGGICGLVVFFMISLVTIRCK